MSAVVKVFKGVLFAIVVSLGLVLIFSLIMKFVDIGESGTFIANQVIKFVAIGIGAMIGAGGNKSLIKGLFIGMFTILINYLIFSTITQNFEFSLSNVWDILFGMAIGGITAIIFSLLKKN